MTHKKDALAGTRCMREAKCENVGAGRTYSNRDACMTEIRGESMNRLTATACPNGLEAAKLDDCLATLRNDHCENMPSGLDRFPTCSASLLCSTRDK